MRNRRVSEGDAHHAAFGIIPTLADGISNFARFAESNAYFSLFVPYDNERTEAKTATAFHYFRRAVDEHHFLNEIASVFSIPAFFGCIRRSAPAAPSVSSTATPVAASRLEITLWLIRHNLFLGSN
jgi:hypothetical protein